MLRKGGTVAHVSLYYFTEVRYLLMCVFQKGQDITLAKLLNSCITLSWQLYSHRASGSEGVRIYHMHHDALFFQSEGADGNFNGSADV